MKGLEPLKTTPLLSSAFSSGVCLVLGGGGARGVYHVGAWKALRELGVRINAVVGNSIGAIVGGFIAQGDYALLESIIQRITISDVISIPEEFVSNGNFLVTGKNLKHLNRYIKDILEKKGLDTLPLLNLLLKNLNEENIRNSGIDLGIVTYQLTGLKPREIFLDEIPAGSLIKYLLASATFPGFSVTVIDKKAYIDGGVYNNLPFSTAKARGYKNIILVDISGPGVNKVPQGVGTRMVYIKNSVTLGGILDFNPDFLKQFQLLGYLDTLKAFGVLKGERYFFDPDQDLEKKMLTLLGSGKELRKIRAILSPANRHYHQVVYILADYAAMGLGLERIRRYSFKELLLLLVEKKIKEDEIFLEFQNNLSRRSLIEFLRKTRKLLSGKTELGNIEKSPYLILQIAKSVPKGYLARVPAAAINGYFPYLPGCCYFIEFLEQNAREIFQH